MKKSRWTNFKLSWRVAWYNFWLDYPAAGWLVAAVKGGIILAIFGAVAFVVSIACGAYGKLPSKESLAGVTHYVASEIYAADSTLLGRYYFENRSNVCYEDISPYFIQALIATEDARYFEHEGVDVRAWLRVFFRSIVLKERSSGGGSTISQQLAKNLYPRKDFGTYSLLINKIKEVFVAIRLEKLYGKEELLELYLNTVPFSENTYGIKVAAHRFYNTSPDQLTPLQSAVLVGMLKATTAYNPIAHPGRALERRNLVLTRMAKYGYLPEAVADSLQKEPIALNYYPITHNIGPAPYFRELLRLDLKERLKDLRKPNGMGYNIYTDGLKIYTTIDYRLQAMAEAALEEHLKQLQIDFDRHLHGRTPWETEEALELATRRSHQYQSLLHSGFSPEAIDSMLQLPTEMKVFDWDKGSKMATMSALDSVKYYLGLLNAGFLALDPLTGEVQAWVGGIDHEYFQYDHVLSKRQPGSTFKPFVYAAAIDRGLDPCAYWPNVLRSYPQYEGWTPKNAKDEYGGYYSMKGGLSNSINTVTVQIMMQTGPRRVAEMANKLGIASPILGVPSIALGAADVSLLDLVTAYSTFAARGMRPEVHYIRRIETADGVVLLDYDHLKDTCDWPRPLSVDEADMMNDMLQAAINSGTGRRIRFRYNMKQPLAGKTGTSQNHADGWFVGYTPRLVAGAWVGAESPAVRFRDLSLGQGANTALPIVANFIQRISAEAELSYLVNTRFPQPSEAVREALDCPNKMSPQPQEQPDAEPDQNEQGENQAADVATSAPIERKK
jgi:penicillin-binding protein 1A